jgi:hypothetical protein
MASQNIYVAGCNIWWMDIQGTVTPGVPLKLQRVLELAEHLYSTPGVFSGMVHIGVPKDFNVLEHKGALCRVSPEEMVHALMFAVANAISSKADDSTLQAYRRLMLSVTFRFEVLETEDERYWRSCNLREELVAKHAAVRRTALQTIFEIMTFKTRWERVKGVTLKPFDIAKLYKEQVKQSKDSEAISENMVRDCIMVFQKALCVDGVRQCIDQLEEKCGLKSPFNSTSKLMAMAQRSQEDIAWVFESITDAVLRGMMTADALSLKALAPKANAAFHASSGSAVGLLELLCLKRRALQFLTNEMLPSIGFKVDEVVLVRQALDSHKAWAHKIAGPAGGPSANISWMAKLSPALVEALRFIEAGLGVDWAFGPSSEHVPCGGAPSLQPHIANFKPVSLDSKCRCVVVARRACNDRIVLVRQPGRASNLQRRAAVTFT